MRLSKQSIGTQLPNFCLWDYYSSSISAISDCSRYRFLACFSICSQEKSFVDRLIVPLAQLTTSWSWFSDCRGYHSWTVLPVRLVAVSWGLSPTKIVVILSRRKIGNPRLHQVVSELQLIGERFPVFRRLELFSLPTFQQKSQKY